MQFDAKLSGDAATLARDHNDVFRRLPATVQAFVIVELQKWPTLFAAERRYQRTLLEHLSQLSPDALLQSARGIARVEAEAGVNRITERDPARFQDLAQAALRKRSLVPDWRREVDLFFQQMDPAIESRLYPPDSPRRLVVQLYGSGIAIQPDRLWRRLKETGVRIPLKAEQSKGADGFLRALFGAPENGRSGASLFARVTGRPDFDPVDAWIVESHEALHDVVQDADVTRTDGSLTGLSYDRLRPYRDQLMRALYSKIQSGVESPQAFAAYARSLKVVPDARVFFHPADVIQAFVREVLLTGNGTLFVNNTFVEWAAVQALRRAQPRLLVTRYGIRDKLKPFSSLLLFSQARRSDQIPLVEDPVGSFVDVEQLSYYVWLNAEKSPAYRHRTLYLFLAEEAEEMLAIRSDAPLVTRSPIAAAHLADVCATMAQWLGVPAPERAGQPIAPLVS
jgi:hypothetical protein